MLLKQALTVVIFFINLITVIDCEGPEDPGEIPKVNPEERPSFSYLGLVIDYLQLDEIRENIEHFFPDDDLRFIGQSLAWLGQSMIIRSQLLPQYDFHTRTISLVPFSGNFFRYNSEDLTSLNFEQYTKKLDNLPTPMELENYKSFLGDFGLDPKSIIERYKKTGKRTVIVKKVKDCINLLSFLNIIFDWAKLERIDPHQLRTALKVFVVILNDFEAPSQILDGEFSVDVFSLNVDAIADSVERTAYPERYGIYVRLVPNYPPQNWNELPSAAHRADEERGRYIIDKLTEIVQIAYGNSSRSSSSTTASPTLVLRTSSGIHDVCRSHQSRFKRDLSTHEPIIKKALLVWTFDKNVLKTLKMEYAGSSNMTSLDEFFEDKLKNLSSTVSKTLNQACSKYLENINEKQVHFSSNKTWISWCMKRHRLFHCNENYENTGIIKDIVRSAAKIFSAKYMTQKDVSNKVVSLINHLKDSFLEFPVEFLIEATKEAVLYCSDEKIVSTLECPLEDVLHLGQTVLNWFIEPFHESENSGTKELFNYQLKF